MTEVPCIGIVERTIELPNFTLDYVRCEETGRICVVAINDTETNVIAKMDNPVRPWGRVQLYGGKYLHFAKMMYLP
ncbi:hypothetical protein N9E35_01400 [Candidatus Marinimicrobia bacterium]|nr:hypothetical protein [Candidatus Neomarinimicrobiota bacterium]